MENKIIYKSDRKRIYVLLADDLFGDWEPAKAKFIFSPDFLKWVYVPRGFWVNRILREGEIKEILKILDILNE